MQTQLNHKKIIDLISQDLELPSPSLVAVKILNAVNQDKDALTSLGEVIATDPSLTAKLLKLANSVAFRANGPIKTIDRALTHLGTNLIKNVALSFVISEQFSDAENSPLDLKLFWKRSFVTAIAAEQLRNTCFHKDESIFIAALLLHLGMLVVAQTKGSEYKTLISEAEKYADDLAQLEMESFGYSHFQVAYALLKKWNIADDIAELLLFHPEQSIPAELKKSLTIVRCAEQIASICLDSSIAEKARQLSVLMKDELSIDEQTAGELYDLVAENSAELLRSFEFDDAETRPYSSLIEEANRELATMNLSQAQLVLEMKEARVKAEQLTLQLKKANAKLKNLAYKDGLTCLYNHRYFQESLTNELARATRYHSSLSLILFDIDHFKGINDSLGHQAGDQILVNIANAVRLAVRPSDIVSRHGGDEFAVILPETNEAGAKVFASRLRRCVEGIATEVDKQLLYVTISIGVCTVSQEQGKISKEELICAADKGLYQSKQNGRNQITSIALETLAANA